MIGSSPDGLNVATALANSGLAVTLWEPDGHAADRARHFLGGSSDRQIVVSDDLKNYLPADLVFDALDEDIGHRADIYRLLCDLPDRTLLATVGPTEAPSDGFPQNPRTGRIGFHIFQPSHLRRLVEISLHPDAREEQASIAFDLARVLDRIPVFAPSGRPSAGVRLGRRLYETADMLLLDGAIPHELDEALVEFGFDMGPYEAQDLVGLDVAYADRKRMAASREPDRRYVPISDRMVQEGRLGKKVGVGWYRYPGGGGAVIDPLVEDLAREEAWFAKVEPREFSGDEIRHRIVLALIHEAAAMLADGTVNSVEDINLVSVHGLGFPAGRGGLITFADSLGLKEIHAGLKRLAAEDPVIWSVFPVIEECLRSGSDLSGWIRA